MKKLTIVLVAFFFCFSTLKGQENRIVDDIGSYHYIGYYKEHLVVNEHETWNVYTIIEPDNLSGDKKFKLLEKGNKKI